MITTQRFGSNPAGSSPKKDIATPSITSRMLYVDYNGHFLFCEQYSHYAYFKFKSLFQCCVREGFTKIIFYVGLGRDAIGMIFKNELRV